MGKREHILEAPNRRHNTIHMNHTKNAHHFFFFIGNQNQFIKSNARKGIPKYTRLIQRNALRKHKNKEGKQQQPP